MKITRLNIYPVKSLGGIPLDQAELGVRGLAHDRQWMVVDDIGRFVTQRQLPHMARIVESLDDEALMLSHPGAVPLRIPLQRDDQPRLPVYVWDDQCQALDEGEEAAAWLGAVLGDYQGSGLRLVRFAPDQRRNVEPHFLAPGEQAHTAFADGYPFLVVSEASLAEVNRVLETKGLAPVPMERFRPSIVVDAAEPFAENGWGELSLHEGAVRLGLRKPCQRCKITTVDQATGEIAVPGEPLRTLVQMNTRLAPGGYFGQNAILLAGEGSTLAVGDELSASAQP
ncbi:MOSC domain-containing protein [Halomonas sp.]|uniref:MOSC domain-containing protein n=1 Tax=Halomonas sp. TaxID=1486246 RepID=UPI00298E779D|nr:MOSC N-terminal beta barrel domain-containing protein [Halomonas sp.]MDW7746988.1 MOSC N-terminal beta barrel domain-containing protein [Halomonas sp.]